MVKLSDTACILLSHAARQESGRLHPMPALLDGNDVAARMAIRSLRGQGYIEEVRVDDASAASRSEGDCYYGLSITPAGLNAIGIKRKQGQTKPWSLPTTVQTKSDLLLALLSGGEGATRDELIAATGWLPHTVRAALTGLRKKGHAVIRTDRDGQSCYHIAEAD